MIVVAVVGLLAMIAVPNFIRSRRSAQTSACISNLKTIGYAKDVWAIQDGMQETDTPEWDDLVNEHLRSTPACPAGGAYTLRRVDLLPVCNVSGHELAEK